MIYFIRAQHAPWVKIGHGKNPARRVSLLQVGNHEQLYLVATLDGGQAEEQRLHTLLGGHKRRGEWFEMSGLVRHAVGLATLMDTFDEFYSALEVIRCERILEKTRSGKLGKLAYYERLITKPETGKTFARYTRMFLIPKLKREIAELPDQQTLVIA